jgi:hypothetical protein
VQLTMFSADLASLITDNGDNAELLKKPSTTVVPSLQTAGRVLAADCDLSFVESQPQSTGEAALVP